MTLEGTMLFFQGNSGPQQQPKKLTGPSINPTMMVRAGSQDRQTLQRRWSEQGVARNTNAEAKHDAAWHEDGIPRNPRNPRS